MLLDKWGSLIVECPHLFKFAAEYIMKAEGCEEEMYMFFAEEPNADSLFIKLVEEFERCILSYFAFHWSNAHFMISQVLAGSDLQEPKKKLKDIVMQATREQRFERVTKNLKVARVFTTLVEEMKAIGLATADDSECTDVMVPMAHKDRSPVLLFMGGGMGAGKSTALKDILKDDLSYNNFTFESSRESNCCIRQTLVQVQAGSMLGAFMS